MEPEQAHYGRVNLLMRMRVFQHVADVVSASLLGAVSTIMCNLFVMPLCRNLQTLEKTLVKKLNIDFECKSSCNLLAATCSRHSHNVLTFWHTFIRDVAFANTFASRRGLLTHLQTVHGDLFRQHEGHNTSLLSKFSLPSPCPLCGVAFKQYHKCILVRQMAMLLTREGHEVPHDSHTGELSCPVCFKAYTTKHGLQKHLREYHRATEDCSTLDDATIDIRCHLHEAVQNNRCEDLLQLAEVQHFLATRCVSCNRQFTRRQELTRHFKHNHSSEWHECEKRAMRLDNLYKPLHGCLCQPPLHSKHICTLYLQFILLRIELEREQTPPSAALPPDMMMSLAEQIEPLLWNGHVKLLYKKRHVRFSLTTCCQLCGQRFGTAANLQLHLHEQHAETLQETLHIRELLQWALFMDLGCFCNPSCGWGEALHECVSLSQLAMVAVDFHWELILPGTFSSVELSAVLEPLLPLQTLQKVTMALMTETFIKFGMIQHCRACCATTASFVRRRFRSTGSWLIWLQYVDKLMIGSDF